CRSGARTEVPDAFNARQLFQEGHTISVRHTERVDFRLAELGSLLQQALGGELDVQLFATPAGQFGFGWHYDPEEVFLIQTQGRKTYSLRKNTVNPWPLMETIPVNMRYERELMPVWQCTLEAGDWLYVPNGYWHSAKAETDSITLAVGLMPH